MQPKPFVIVEASGKKIKNRGQGVVVSKDGHVLSAAHIAWIGEDGNYSEDESVFVEMEKSAAGSSPSAFHNFF